ncbi:type II toxin-antitoxin system RelE/ParE family toxin [Parerythrobacter lacustris]|uniref:Toxin n=1 Tax=Parerythrobacter lacustris TaxID=2969984 RepID=A0ABT1XPP0_9SPHN|nr:type II toxin-antitoxin system RelE/ParE family toxin [Parerythrobacter lacustris]MCR2833631.1 type II toxin-antitoxin system RelE/ParE family toxin [Parerythrobacter lacustris]
MRFFLRDAAKLDLADIWLSTANRWGVDQADDYVRAIEDRLSRICDFPESYPNYDCSHGKFRKARSGEHLIFYIISEMTVEVVRVLHSRMDVEDALT